MGGWFSAGIKAMLALAFMREKTGIADFELCLTPLSGSPIRRQAEKVIRFDIRIKAMLALAFMREKTAW